MALFKKPEEKQETKRVYRRLSDGELLSLQVEIRECGGRDEYLVMKKAVRFEPYGNGKNMVILIAPDGSIPYDRLMDGIAQLDYILDLKQEEEDMLVLRETGIDPRTQRVQRALSELKSKFVHSS